MDSTHTCLSTQKLTGNIFDSAHRTHFRSSTICRKDDHSLCKEDPFDIETREDDHNLVSKCVDLTDTYLSTQKVVICSMGYVPGDECRMGHADNTLFSFYEGQKIDVLVAIVQFV